MKNNTSLNIKSNYMLSKWQLKNAGFQKLKDLLSFGKQGILCNILSDKHTCSSLEFMLKRKDFLQAKKHNASVATLAGGEKISHPDGQMPKVLIRPYCTLVVLYNNQRSNVFISICDRALWFSFVQHICPLPSWEIVDWEFIRPAPVEYSNENSQNIQKIQKY